VANSVQRRTYVLDTSVLLADPNAFTRFDEHHVVLPVVVITELEAKRHHPELGYFARQALRYFDDLRLKYGRLDAEIQVGDLGGTARVELNHIDSQVLPAGFRLGDNDTRILSVAKTCRYGSRRRRSGWMRRSTGPSCPLTRAGPAWPS
jgi:PhoH-like ATPase